MHLNEADVDLKRRINIFLCGRGVSCLRVGVEVADGTVTFRGTVGSFYERQLCLACKHIPGVRKLVDDLKVVVPVTREKPTVSALG
jgi:osmotically-inducible protein OsmY